MSDALIFVNELKNNDLKTFSKRTYPSEYNYGQYSDDTQFSILLIKSLIECGKLDAKDYLQKLLKEYKAKTLIGLGKNTRKIFDAYLKQASVLELTNISSNGSLMRAWPIGLIPQAKDLLWKYSEEQSQLTHCSQEAISACGAMALIVNYCFINPNANKQNFAKEIGKYLDNKFLFLNLNEFEDHILSEYYHPDWELIPPGALVTLKAVLYSSYNNFESFESAIYAGLSLGGDTDSVAALIGSLMGTKLGLSSIPEKWLSVPYDSNFGSYNELIELSIKFMESLASFENHS